MVMILYSSIITYSVPVSEKSVQEHICVSSVGVEHVNRLLDFFENRHLLSPRILLLVYWDVLLFPKISAAKKNYRLDTARDKECVNIQTFSINQNYIPAPHPGRKKDTFLSDIADFVQRIRKAGPHIRAQGCNVHLCT